MSIKFVSLFPAHLDLNGDQGNLKVMQKRLEWAGHKSVLESVEKGQPIPVDADFIFIGHGSKAAWSDIDEALVAIKPQLIEMISNGVGFMAVASGYERSIEMGIFEGKLESTDRLSKFEIQKLADFEVLGYLNAATSAPVVQKIELKLGTQLHGPFFAKNPDLVDAYLGEILTRKSATSSKPSNVSIDPLPELKHNAGRVADIVKAVWELEKNLASE